MSKHRRIVLMTVVVLLMTGLVMIYSSSAVYAFSRYGDSAFFVKKHLFYMGIGGLAAFLFMTMPVGWLKEHSRGIMLLFMLMLVMVLVPGLGTEAGGARRWFRFFGMGIQPSEISKFAIIIYLADFISRKKYLMKNLRYGFSPAVAVVGMTSFLVLLEPDMGTAVSILFIGFMMMFVGGARIKHLAMLFSGVVPVIAAAIIAAPYRVKRVMTFYNPWADPRGAGFQLCQSFIALGSGGLWGVGLGESKQKLFYLPESHTDFIYSIIGEELGFVGTASILTLFLIFIFISMRISFNIDDPFASKAVFGIAAMIAFEVIVNIGVSAGALPTKGLPLPFISYGGSSLVCHLGAVGLMLNLSREAS